VTGRRLTVAGCLALTLTFAVTTFAMPWSDERVRDLPVYSSDAAAFLDGMLPYRDVPFEYPPLAAPALALPGVLGTAEGTYRWSFAVLMLACGFCVVALVQALARSTGGDERLAVLGVAVAPLLLGAVLRNHFDLLPVALTLASLVLVLRGRPLAGFGVLGAAVMTKGFPLVVAPVALAWLVARGQRRAALEGFVALGAVVAVVALVAVAISPSGTLDSVRYQTDRPVQVESLASFGVRAVDSLGGTRAVPVNSYKSDGLLSSAGGAFTGASVALGLAALALLCAGAARRRDERALVLAALGAVAAFATFGKVLSPQYLVWVLPLGALALAWRRWALAAAVGAASVLTFVEFPSRYFDLVAGRGFPLTVVAIRDALLVLVVALAVAEVWPARRRLATR
jgi:uncharacterized membrane protein